MNTVSQKKIHAKLTKAFTFAFAEAQKKGIKPENFSWFQSERTKDSLESNNSKRSA